MGLTSTVANHSSPQHVRDGNGLWLGQIEPAGLVNSFLAHLPAGFQSLSIASERQAAPGFVAHFDLLTTLDDAFLPVAKVVRGWPAVELLVKRPAVFLGTTVSEYCLVPDHADYAPLVADCLRELQRQRADLLIVKDLPVDSPLLSTNENAAAARLSSQCQQAGFQLLSGLALAYVAIDFASREEYLQRLSRSRRKDIRRKLRTVSSLSIEELETGDRAFHDPSFVEQLYQLYMNVYQQSKFHFDLLTLEFFKSVLQDRQSGGVIVLYRQQQKLIGFNLLYVFNGNLVDKYVGFAYPDAPDANLYFVSWFYNLDYALRHRLKHYIAGWTDPEVKAALGAKFTFTQHAVYLANPILRFIFNKTSRYFECDKSWAEKSGLALAGDERR